MHQLLAIGGLLFVAAITPGPNNLVVLRAAERAGMRAALPAIVGIVLGGLLLLGVAVLGAGAAFATHPSLRWWLAAIGSLYLAWLGMLLLASGIAPRADSNTGHPMLPAGTPGLIGFQFLNPKSWVMVLTVLAAFPAAGLPDYLSLAGLFVLIPGVCLLLWAWLGAWLARWLARPPARRGIDMLMGALLFGCAFLLLLDSRLPFAAEIPL